MKPLLLCTLALTLSCDSDPQPPADKQTLADPPSNAPLEPRPLVAAPPAQPSEPVADEPSIDPERPTREVNNEIKTGSEKGKLGVNAIPWAKVRIDGKGPLVETPFLYDVYAGMHILVFDCPSQKQLTETVHVEAGRTATVTVNCRDAPVDRSSDDNGDTNP